MGCCKSKSRLGRALNKSDYKLDALEDFSSLKKSPNVLECEEADDDNFISPMLFHNLFYSGFYAPYIFSPKYMLIVDCRSESEFNLQHVRTAVWRGALDSVKHQSSEYMYVVLYDDIARDARSTSEKMLLVSESLKSQSSAPLFIRGGFSKLFSKYSYMFSSKGPTNQELVDQPLTWYPSWVSDRVLVGRVDQAHNPSVVLPLKITHIINLMPTTQIKCDSKRKFRSACAVGDNGAASVVFSHVKYLHVPLEDSHRQDILESLIKILEFIYEAEKVQGRVLIHCDQGVDRAAAVTVAFLMSSHAAPLEAAFRRLKSLRPAIQISSHLLQQLSEYETHLFGRKLTNLGDLEF